MRGYKLWQDYSQHGKETASDLMIDAEMSAIMKRQ